MDIYIHTDSHSGQTQAAMISKTSPSVLHHSYICSAFETSLESPVLCWWKHMHREHARVWCSNMKYMVATALNVHNVLCMQQGWSCHNICIKHVIIWINYFSCISLSHKNTNTKDHRLWRLASSTEKPHDVQARTKLACWSFQYMLCMPAHVHLSMYVFRCHMIIKLHVLHFTGVLAGKKKQGDEGYKFVEICQWFASRADLIILLFDPFKVDISDELEEVRRVRGRFRIMLGHGMVMVCSWSMI